MINIVDRTSVWAKSPMCHYYCTWKCSKRVQRLVPQFAPTCAMADFEEASLAGFFLDNRLCQITVQTFSIIIATFPSANTYLCCWRCLLVNNIWLYDCALTCALSCFIKDVEPSPVYKTTLWWPRKRRLDIDRSINRSLYHYFIVRPNADYTNSPLSLSHVGITGHVRIIKQN